MYRPPALLERVRAGTAPMYRWMYRMYRLVLSITYDVPMRMYRWDVPMALPVRGIGTG